MLLARSFRKSENPASLNSDGDNNKIIKIMKESITFMEHCVTTTLRSTVTWATSFNPPQKASGGVGSSPSVSFCADLRQVVEERRLETRGSHSRTDRAHPIGRPSLQAASGPCRPITVNISLSQPGALISLSFQRQNLSERERVSGESFQL